MLPGDSNPKIHKPAAGIQDAGQRIPDLYQTAEFREFRPE